MQFFSIIDINRFNQVNHWSIQIFPSPALFWAKLIQSSWSFRIFYDVDDIFQDLRGTIKSVLQIYVYSFTVHIIHDSVVESLFRLHLCKQTLLVDLL